MATPTVKETDTLDMTFHIVDGTAVGNSFTWKFNNPLTSVNSLSAVRDAMGGASGFLSDWFKNDTDQSVGSGVGCTICSALGYPIDNVDAARKVQTVVTKEDLG